MVNDRHKPSKSESLPDESNNTNIWKAEEIKDKEELCYHTCAELEGENIQ